jgi:hypothetical protein
MVTPMENSPHLLGTAHKRSSINWSQLTLKQTAVILLCFLFCFVAVVYCFLVIVFPSNSPPREKQLLKNFYAHRASYERLRDMLLEDQELLVVASWGVETRKFRIPRIPPDGDFPVKRFNQYLAEFNQIGSRLALRAEGDHPRVCIAAWAGGWGGDTRHVDVCWIDHEPADEVTSLDDYHKNPKRGGHPRSGVFRHIEGNWYLWGDW